MRRRITRREKCAVFVTAGAIALAVVLYAVFRAPEAEKAVEGIKKAAPTTAPRKEALPVKPSPPRTGKRIAIVIDDVGYDEAMVKKILSLDAPVTIAVLPSCPYSVRASRDAHRAGREVILHLPMEPHDYPAKNPGKGALLASMDHGEIERQLEKDLLSVPFARGVNNHMGSRFMEDEDKMAAVMAYLKHKDLFFLDSMTTPRTLGIRMARRWGVRCESRDVFIDNEESYSDTMAILRKIANSRDDWNTLILIGHSRESTIEALRSALPLFRARGITIVPLSRIVG